MTDLITEKDYQMLLGVKAHLGSKNCVHEMLPYIYTRRTDGVFLINPQQTMEKLMLAARVIASVENLAEVVAISARPYGQRAVLKFAHYVGCQSYAGRFTPGTFTNQLQPSFTEPRLLICMDPHTDSQPILEASYANIPVIAFCDTDAPLRFVDVAVPCNTKSKYVGLMWWMLAREVLRLRGDISRKEDWEVMPDLFFYRDPEEQEKADAAQAAQAKAAEEGEFAAEAADGEEQWAGAAEGAAAKTSVDWADDQDWAQGEGQPEFPVQAP